MCGIVGYVGADNATDILLEGLSSLEYRGYDSAGISVFAQGALTTVKARGRLQDLIDKLEQTGRPKGNCGIGHTRWATHGAPSDANAHPHFTTNVSLVHNGIIENYLEIKDFLSEKGYTFTSETDTECAAKLIDYYYKGSPEDAIRQAAKRVEGSYAWGILFAGSPQKIYAIRKGSPLIVGRGGNGNFIASDVPAILRHTRNYHLLEEGELAVVEAGSVTVFSPGGDRLSKALLTADWDVAQAQKDGFPHFMLKEIYEQPKALADTLRPRIENSLPCFTADGLPAGFFSGLKKIYITACGTASYAGVVGRALIESLARVPVEVELASEFRYRNPVFLPDSLVIVISQSGETADTLAALRLARQEGLKTLAIVNVTGSTIAREADYVLHTYAGPEIAVASTKAYSVQVAMMYLIAISTALEQEKLSPQQAASLTASLLDAVEKTRLVLPFSKDLERLAPSFQDTHSLFYLGRGLDYALAMEGSLKLKEISYIHSEAYAAGELKHGTISLITEGVPVVALATQKALLPKIISNIKEARARGGSVVLITKEGFSIDKDIYDFILRLPEIDDLFMPLLAVIVLQLLAYHTAVARGCDVDKPRNLAKSVTVE